jgi:hypothetical protein
MHTKPDLRVFWRWMIIGFGSVIVAVLGAIGIHGNIHEQDLASRDVADSS